MPGRSISTRRSSRDTTASRDTRTPRRTSPRSGSTVSARRPPWSTSGGGPGTPAPAAAPHVGRVVAVDVSAAMLALLRQRAAAAGLANVECVQAGFLSYAHAGPPADAVFTRNALHQLPDFWKALSLDRMATLLLPCGVLRLRDLIFDFQPAEAEAVLDGWLDGAV